MNPCRWTLALALAWISLLTGCASHLQMQLQFDPNRPLTYRFTSSREIHIQWGTESAAGDPNQSSTITESLVYVMTYTPQATTADGLTRLAASCREARVQRSNSIGVRRAMPRDPAEKLAGQTFSLVVDAQGRIVDAQELDALLKKLAEQAFREGPGDHRIKDPEMISDITATQWFLFDALSHLDQRQPATGYSWTSRQLIPAPMVIRQARDITYTLSKHRYTDQGHLVDVTSTSALSPKTPPSSWPIPYSGSFQVSGTFGFLRGYQSLSLSGKGLDIFNLNTGVLSSSDHTYQWVVKTQALPLTTVQASPVLVIAQTLKMEQL